MNKIAQKLDNLLNSMTMYRLVLYVLLWLVSIAILMSALGALSVPVVSLLLYFSLMTLVGFVVNNGLAKLYGVPPNFESGIITTIIVFFVMNVPTKPQDWLVVSLALFLALTSKYLIVWRGSHIFNPAAFGVFVVSVSGLGFASWWVATPVLFPFLLIASIVVLRKTRRVSLFISFLLPSVFLLLLHGTSLSLLILSFPLLFFGSIMLTEPATSPNMNKWRIVYGFLVGIIVGAGFGALSAPQTALVVGNALAFMVSFRASTRLTLVEKKKHAENIYEFVFDTSRPVTFSPGQYIEWTLPNIPFNSRGNRRTFTIASSPLEKQIRLGVKFYDPSSVYKKHLLNLQKNDHVFASHVGGDFILPRKKNKKIALVAGGIGITPFVAMLRHIIKTKQHRDVVLFYFAVQKQEIAFQETLEAAKKFGVKTVEMIGDAARLDQKLLEKECSDFREREFFISGPPPMVSAYVKSLKKQNVSKVHTDYFFGY